jgi:hypothetical protein
MWADVEIFRTLCPEDGAALVVDRAYVATIRDVSRLDGLRGVFERLGGAIRYSFMVSTYKIDPRKVDFDGVLPDDWPEVVRKYRCDLSRGPAWPEPSHPWPGTPTCHVEPGS